VVKLIIRLIVNAIALWVAVQIVSGVEFAEGTGVIQVLFIALVFGLVNAVIKPILTLVSLPFIVLTLGLFTLLINTFLLWFVSLFTPLIVEGLIPAFLGSIVVSLASWLLNWFVSDD
jgi:putative membrane protein